MLDIFKSDAFSLQTLTALVNERPYVPGRLGMMNLFQSSGVNTLTISIESIKGTLQLVPFSERGGPGHQHKDDKRELRDFRLPHMQVDDFLPADQIQGVREFGTENQLQTIQGRVLNKFDSMFSDIDATQEHIRMGAVKGVIVDADGSTVLYDLFDEFNQTQDPDVDFTLGTATTNVKQLCNTVVRRMWDILGATPAGQVWALCGDEFYDKLATFPEVEAAYADFQSSAQRNDFLRSGGMVYDLFPYGNIVWENYRGSVNGVPYVATNECQFFVTGVPGLFLERFGPADYVETVNTIGLPRYAKSMVARNDKGVDLEAQSNCLALCTRPLTLRKGLTSN